jgi:hypothetical protein
MREIRSNGKISAGQWRLIAEAYFERHEPIADIARDFHVTSPAIRYIVKRIAAGHGSRRSHAGEASLLGFTAQPAGELYSEAPSSVHVRAIGAIAVFLTALNAAAATGPLRAFSLQKEACHDLVVAMSQLRLEIEERIVEHEGTRKRRRPAAAIRARMG